MPASVQYEKIAEARSLLPESVVTATRLAEKAAPLLGLTVKQARVMIKSLPSEKKRALKLVLWGESSDDVFKVFRSTRSEIAKNVVSCTELAERTAPKLHLNMWGAFKLWRAFSWNQKFELKYGFAGVKDASYWNTIMTLRRALATLTDYRKSHRRQFVTPMDLAMAAAPLAGLTADQMYAFICNEIPSEHKTGLNIRTARVKRRASGMYSKE